MSTLTYSLPFVFVSLLVCFPTAINNSAFISPQNDFEYGNIETFLCNDPFYPYTSIGTRYSYIQNQYIQDFPNCAKIPFNNNNQIQINTTTFNDPIIFFMNASGIVRGPKSGIKPNNTDFYENSPESMSIFIKQMENKWNTKAISPGLLLNMIPNLLSKHTLCVDEELVYSVNQSIYNGLKPDPRNPNDPTRKTGVFPKCSGPSCYNNEFRGKRTKQPIVLHDQMFRTDLLLRVAQEVLQSAVQCTGDFYVYLTA